MESRVITAAFKFQTLPMQLLEHKPESSAPTHITNCYFRSFCLAPVHNLIHHVKSHGNTSNNTTLYFMRDSVLVEWNEH
jgi:hypothetical protein